MKLTTFLLVIALLQVSAKGLSQISVSQKNIPAEAVMKAIEQQTGYVFIYDEAKVQLGTVNVDVHNASITETLQQLFKNLPITYQIIKKNIVLQPKVEEPSALDKIKTELGIPVSVQGKITDTLETAIIGANVTVKGTNKSTITDEDGEFSISAQNGDIITISYIGYEAFEFKVRNNIPFLNIVLHPDVKGLAEVVVNTGFQTLPVERATGSFTQVDSATFDRRVSNNVLDRLEGIVPGLLVNRNVNAINNSNGIDISIRGTSTLYSNTQPLIVVDNFPYDGNIQDINPDDVESITVLKDAAAASIWGVQSGNGVIVITTKKGHREQKLAITTDASITVGQKPDLFYSPDFLDSKDFISVEQSLFSQGFYDSRLTSRYEEPVSPVVQLLADERAGSISATDVNSQISNYEGIDVRNDLEKYFYQNSVDQQYYANFKGGGINNDYIYSVGYDDNLSNMVGNGNKRLNFSAANNFYPFKNFTISTGLYFIQNTGTVNSPVNNIVTGGGYANIYPYAQLVDNSGNGLPIVKDYNYAWITNPTAQQGLLNWQYNPLDELHNADNTTKLADNRIDVGAKYVFFNGFSADLKYQYETSSSNATEYYSEATYYARNLINEYTNLSSADPNPIPIGGILQQSDVDLSSEKFRGQLNYAKEWNTKNSINAILGTEIDQTITTDNNPITQYGFNASNGSYQNVDYTDEFTLTPQYTRATIPTSGGQDKFTNNYIGYFTNASYTYDNKYTFSASGRIDKSNLFGVNTNQKSVPLYSLGLLWNLGKEDFYHLDWLPNLKLRFTYGYNGNINTSATAVTTIQQSSGSYYFGIPLAQIANPGDPDLQWEKDRLINLGIDFGSKDNILTGTIEYYQKKGTDLFGTEPLAPSTGNATIYANTANIAGNGVDISLNWKIIRTTNFKWLSTFLYSYALDKVTKYDVQFPVSDFLSDDANGGSITPVDGKPIFSIYSYKSGPLTHNTGDPQGYLNGQLSTNYSSIIANTSFNDLKFNGSARPTSFGSFRNTFSYQNWSLSANIIYKLGYYFRRTSIDYASLFEDWIGNSDFDKRWMKPGDETKTIVPSMPTFANLDENRDIFYEDEDKLVDNGDHVRLEDITLNYTFSRPRIFKRAFNNISLYGYINNVGILWRANHDHLDPDLYSGELPLPRTYSLGIKTNF